MRQIFAAKQVFTLVATLASGAALAGAPVPPERVERGSYAQWLTQVGASANPYTDFVFTWFEEQLSRSLPPEAGTDPEKLFVTVDRPLAEAVRLESSGDVEEGTTYGLETYAVVDAPVGVVLETILFRWGKPVGQERGVTRPGDTVYGFREERLAPEWGPGAYKTITTKRNGGIAGDQNDSHVLLVRGGPQEGYVLAGSFLAPTGDTITSSFLTLILIRPLAGGKTEYRVSGMMTGQNYAYLGIEHGRRNFGFNVGKIREGQREFLGQVKSLRETGKIPETGKGGCGFLSEPGCFFRPAR